jgi:hypothetical protein
MNAQVRSKNPAVNPPTRIGNRAFVLLTDKVAEAVLMNSSVLVKFVKCSVDGIRELEP